MNFQGYYNNPQSSREAVDDEGFIKTGDLGYVDENGFLYITDRKKDIFKYKGHHINPSEIENVIQQIKGVEFAVVVGIPNDETFNLISAVVKKKEGFEALKEQEIFDYVAESLPGYKHLHGGVYFVEGLPSAATGKILKREIKNIATKMFDKNIDQSLS